MEAQKSPEPIEEILNSPPMDSVKDMQNSKVRFSCLGVGCVGWLIIIGIITACIILYQKL